MRRPVALIAGLVGLVLVASCRPQQQSAETTTAPKTGSAPLPAPAAAPAGSPDAARPPVIGRTAAVSAGHPLTTAAAFDILLKGGNAFDAGVTAMLVGGVLEQDLYSLGGEGTALVYPRKEKKVLSLNGV